MQPQDTWRNRAMHLVASRRLLQLLLQRLLQRVDTQLALFSKNGQFN